MLFDLSWTDFKTFITDRNLNIQFIDLNDTYWLKAFDGNFNVQCVLQKNDPNVASDIADFEINYKTLPTTNTSPNSLVTTQYELNNKDLKLARASGVISSVSGIDGVSGSCTCYVISPGTFGQDLSGRYVAGGYAIIDSYDLDDYVLIYVEDKDRLLAAVYAEQQGVSGVMSDDWMQANTVYVNYPILKSYTDDEQPPENQGWYFWPLVTGNGPPFGECEVEPIGGYGFIPAGFYVKLMFMRPNLTSGNARVMLYWGKYSTT